MKNKRASISITILVLGVFLVGSFALLTFFISDFKFSNSFVGVELMKGLNYDIDEYKFYLNQGFSSEDIKSIFDTQIDSLGRDVLVRERRSPDSFLFKDKLLFSVEYPIQ